MRTASVVRQLKVMAVLLLSLAPGPSLPLPRPVPPTTDSSSPPLPPCPSACRCLHAAFPSFSRPLLTVNCTGAGLNALPSDLPNGTEALLLAHNRLLNLSSLPPLPRLRLLDLSHNSIAYLANHWVFEHLGQLRELYLRGNALKTLQHGSFSGLGGLSLLDVSDNRLRTLELHAFGGLNHLSVLRLGRNDLYELKRAWLLSMTSLRELYLPANHISVLEPRTFDKITSLLHLDVSDNGLRAVAEGAFVGLQRVKVLNLSDNALDAIPTKELQRLTGLDILLLDGAPKIRQIKEGDFKDMAVSSLSLSFLPALQLVQRAAFSNLTQLRTLQLHDNPQLLFIHPQAFSGVPALHRLLLHNNQLLALSVAVRDALPALDELHLYHNPLHCDCNVLWLRRDMEAQENGTGTGYIQDADKLECTTPEASSHMQLAAVPLPLLAPVCPPTTLPFFAAATRVTLGDPLTLTCQALGLPPPSLCWTLPDGTTVNGSTAPEGLLSEDTTRLTLPGLGPDQRGTYACRADNALGYDISSTAVTVVNRDLRLALAAAASDHLTVTWAGSIPRLQMVHFHIAYRQQPQQQQRSGDGDDDDHDKKTLGDNNDAADDDARAAKFSRVYLHGGMQRCTLTGLARGRTYEVCLVYRQTFPVQCRNFSTSETVAALSGPAISRLDLTGVAASLSAALGVLVVLCLARVVARRLRRRKDYHDPLAEGADMDKIPLEPIDHRDHRAPGTPLCSSRTALLPHSQI